MSVKWKLRRWQHGHLQGDDDNQCKEQGQLERQQDGGHKKVGRAMGTTREMMEQLGMMGVMLGVAALMVSSPPLVSPYSSNQW
jgi:hypothetical protein